MSAARSTASRSLATAPFKGALARDFLQIGKHEGVSSSCRPGANSECRLTPPEGCHGGDSLIRIDKKGIEGEGSFPADPLN